MSSSRKIELLKGLEAAPFYLQQQDLDWVEKVFDSMSLDEKIGQLFCPIGFSTDPGYLQGALLRHHIGGLFFRNGESSEMQETFRYAQSHSKIPLLIPSNLEAGGNGAATDGTAYGMPLAVSAAKDSKYAYRLGKVACSEGAAIGINWAFAPVVDIDLNCHNPITNVRTFGSQAEVVYRCASQYLKAAKEENVAVSIKHFPGDGVDERDQHLLTSINSLSREEWDESFGMVYKKLIEEDALTIMAGHIALPSYQGFFNAETAKQVIPASLSKELLYDLLRKQLGFNGMIVTDASPMLGFTCAMERAKAVPYSIECGCDMFLFNKDLEEDYGFMMEGYKRGILSEERLEEAVLRILGLKAALKLHTKKADNSLVPNPEHLQKVGCQEHQEWAKELADASVTLVKDTQKILPLRVEKHRRVLLQILGDFDSNERIRKTVEVELEKRGFIVSHYEKE
ncbi:MAG: glycoside hydrolase family 3 protein, partial [Vallitaleaceae bacterium]|nr:glycoside hydrolase family 3 protein [Vallitaleaceae bacterium]